MTDQNTSTFKEEALAFHRLGKPGKLEVAATKPLLTQRDLSLAYSPGVAFPCLEISTNPDAVYEYTAKGNMVAVITNGTAVLGLGSLGAAASKPVMEGKSVLFKKFADIDSIDIEVDTEDPEEFISAVKYIGKSWGGINLEDIKAPECFIIEKRLQELLDIPVFHDDQHGTAIITAAAVINALHINGKNISEVKFVSNGSGAAGIATIELLIKMGLNVNNIIMCDKQGVIYEGRIEGMNPWKAKYAAKTHMRTLSEAMVNADIFLGLSAKGVVSKDMVKSMAKDPIILAMANPDPEILPEDIKSVRDDAIIATGRSDYNNQVNNVMCFPYIFRGALDVRAKTINEEMKIAAAKAIAELARQPVPEEARMAYKGKAMQFGPEYIIPVPFDPRLIQSIPVAVAEAAINSGVARVKDFDLVKYVVELRGRLDPGSNYMNILYNTIKQDPQRVIFAEGDEPEVIRAALIMRDNGYAKPILVGRMSKIHPIVAQLGENINLEGIEIVNASTCPNLEEYIQLIYTKLQRRGYIYRDCSRLVKSDRNVFASCLLSLGRGDCLLTGVTKSYFSALEDVLKVIPPKEGERIFGYSVLLAEHKEILISDCSVNEVPTPAELADIAIQTAKIAKNMGYTPRVAMLSFANFGNPNKEKALRITEATEILRQKNVDFEFDGEMSPDVALNETLMGLYPFSKLSKPANILIMPTLNSAVISTKLFEELGKGKVIGPVLSGLSKPVQICEVRSSAEKIVHLATFGAYESITNKNSSGLS
ncbi:MAG: NADP-dependent malic enzyme [Alphaproteobacteria bacterium]|nr:NADP-dependent malic enzyme [Alphaproteobacteria bacterium]